MADVTVTVDSAGDGNNPGILVDQTIQWVLASGVAGPFSLYPPPNMFHNDDNPSCVTLQSSTPNSPTYTVKHSATVGDHTYSIDNGACTGQGRPKPETGMQKITVDAGRAKTAGSR